MFAGRHFFRRLGRGCLWGVALGLAILSAWNCTAPAEVTTPAEVIGEEIEMKLPEPQLDGPVSLEKSLKERRSIRDYASRPLELKEISQLLWAAQGITAPGGLRTAPSAGATYPLEVHVVAGNVRGLAAGVYRYRPYGHLLLKEMDGDVRDALAEAALGQEWVAEGAASFVVTAVYTRTTARYGERGIRYVHIEVGHAAQNLCLQATALGLGSVPVGAFDDTRVGQILRLPGGENPIYIIPVGAR